MSIRNLIPTSHQTPDAGQGGIAADSSSDTGASGSSSVFGDGVIGASELKSCRWFSFQSPLPGGALTSALKVTYSGSGSLAGGLVNNNFRLQYTLNGGGVWTTIHEQIDFNATIGPATFSLPLSLAQDLTQVQIRVRESASAFNVGDTASAGFSVSDVRVEVSVQDPQVIVMM